MGKSTADLHETLAATLVQIDELEKELSNPSEKYRMADRYDTALLLEKLRTKADSLIGRITYMEKRNDL